jgi:hypothetical protein
MVALVAWLVVATLVPTFVHAQVGNPFDHLKCYKIKDPTKAKYVADLVPLQQPPFQVEPGCLVKFPARLFCIPVQKTNVQPPPPGAVNGKTGQDYLVYQIRCPNVAVVKGGMPLPVTDQFASRTVFVGKHQFLMVPAFKQSHLCHNGAVPGAPPVCGGDCTNPSAKCVQIPGTTQCGCESPCGIDATGTCGGTCPHAGQDCHVITLSDGTAECTCDPIVDGHPSMPRHASAADFVLKGGGMPADHDGYPRVPTGIRHGSSPAGDRHLPGEADDGGCEWSRVGRHRGPCAGNASAHPINLTMSPHHPYRRLVRLRHHVPPQ